MAASNPVFRAEIYHINPYRFADLHGHFCDIDLGVRTHRLRLQVVPVQQMQQGVLDRSHALFPPHCYAAGLILSNIRVNPETDKSLPKVVPTIGAHAPPLARRQHTPMSPKLSITVQKISHEIDYSFR